MLRDLSADAPASVLAFVTTLHVALLVLRRHRTCPTGFPRLILLPSILFCASPWLLPRPDWLAGTFAAHLAWFLTCEWLAQPYSPRGDERPKAPVPRPGVSPILTSAPSANPVQKGFFFVPVLAVLDETPDIKTFRLARPEGLDFSAGQFLMVRVQVEGKHLVRCYSISSAPECAGAIEISVKRQGVVSGTLHATVAPGSRLSVQGPRGSFIYPDQDERPIVLVAGGVGITPLMGMLRHALAADPGRPVTLLFSVRTEQDIVYRDELLVLSRRHPQFRLAIALSRGSSNRLFLSGRLDRDLISSFVTDPHNPIYMLCGPTPMIDSTKKLLAGMGVPASQMRSEAFEPASAAAATTAAAMEAARSMVGVAASGGSPGSRRDLGGSRGAVGTSRLTLARCGRTVAIAAGQSLLEAAEAAGVEIPSLCRSGACGTCRTRLIRGQIEGDSSVLDEEDRASGYILPCVASAKGDCVLDA